MKLSKKSEYALRALIEIAARGPQGIVAGYRRLEVTPMHRQHETPQPWKRAHAAWEPEPSPTGRAIMRQWLDYQDQDLWLVPELDSTGNHTYLAPQEETYTHAFLNGP